MQLDAKLNPEPLSVRFLVMAISLALLLWIGANGAIFLWLYGDTLTPLTLPYLETFSGSTRLDYRRVLGQWQIQDHSLVQNDATLADVFAIVPIDLAPTISYQFSTQLRVLEGPNGAGLLFNMQHGDVVAESQLVRFGSSDGRAYLAYGYFDQAGQFVQQGAGDPPDLSQGVELAVIAYPDHYDILVNGQPFQREIPLEYHGGRVALTTWFSKVSFDNVALTTAIQTEASQSTASQPIATASESTAGEAAAAAPTPLAVAPAAAPPNTPGSDTLLYAQNFAEPVDQSQWTRLSGDWQFMPEALIQQQVDGYDYSLIYAGDFSQYHLTVRFQHRAGAPGGGVLFNLPESTVKTLGHMVRYYEGRSLVWGYFDANGNFVGQGDQAIAPPGDQSHTLEITANGTTYAIFLDGELMAAEVPLFSPHGHIGLTASQSAVAFERIEVSALPVEQ